MRKVGGRLRKKARDRVFEVDFLVGRVTTLNLRFVILAILLTGLLSARSWHEVASLLGHPESSKRTKAREVLLQGGWEALLELKNFKSDHPATLSRVREIRKLIELGLDLEGSPEVRKVVLEIIKVAPQKSMELVRRHADDLARCPRLLAGLHSFAIRNPWAQEKMEDLVSLLEMRLRLSFRQAGHPFELLEIRRYHPRTLAIFFQRIGEDEALMRMADQTYRDWLKKAPEISGFHTKDSVMIELRRLRERGEVEKALKELAQIEERAFFEEHQRWLRSWVKIEPYLVNLPEDVALCRALLAVHLDSREPDRLVPAYRAFRNRHPKLSRQLGGGLERLEALRLRQEGGFYESYAFLQGVPEGRQWKVVEIRRLAKWARENIDQLNQGLPGIKREGAKQATILLEALASTDPNESPIEARKKVDRFLALLAKSKQSEEWRKLIFTSTAYFLRVVLSLEDGSFSGHLKELNEGDARLMVATLARLLKKEPAALAKLEASKLDLRMMRLVLAGFLSEPNIEDLERARGLADRWRKMQPEVLDAEGDAKLDQLRFYLRWKERDLISAYDLLLQSKMPDYQKGALIAFTLRGNGALTVEELSKAAELNNEVISKAIEKSLGDEPLTPSTTLNAVNLGIARRHSLADRDAGASHRLTIVSGSLGRLRTRAFKLALIGKRDQAFFLLKAAFLFNRNGEDRSYPAFAAWSYLSDQSSRVIHETTMNHEKVPMYDARKMMRLMFAAEEFSAMRPNVGAMEGSVIYRDFLVATGAWEVLASSDLPPAIIDPARRIAWSRALAGDRESANEKTFGDSDLETLRRGQVAKLTAGSSLGIADFEHLRSPQPGGLWNPWQKEVRILDLWCEVHKQLQAGNTRDAGQLLKDGFARLVLDPKLAAEKVTLIFEWNQEESRRQREFTVSNLGLALFLTNEFDLPSPMASRVVWGLSQMGAGVGEDLYRPAAHYFWSQGEPERALRLLRLSLFSNHKWPVDHGWSKVAMLYLLRAECALETAKRENLHLTLSSLVKHAPHRPDEIGGLLDRLQPWRRKTVEQTVMAWWAKEIEDHPGDRQISLLRDKWKDAFSGNRNGLGK